MQGNGALGIKCRGEGYQSSLKVMGNQGSGHSLRAQGCEFLPQNNQLQELPYNELSRLRSLRTLNLHNNLISSEGEG